MSIATISRFSRPITGNWNPLAVGLAFTWCRPVQFGSSRRTMASAMAKRLEGKTIVVTGASSGIGKSTGYSIFTVRNCVMC